jgi:hypothetical protein
VIYPGAPSIARASRQEQQAAEDGHARDDPDSRSYGETCVPSRHRETTVPSARTVPDRIKNGRPFTIAVNGRLVGLILASAYT